MGVPGPSVQRGSAPCPRLARLNPNSFDGRGNYAFGLKEQLIFPEIEYDKVDKIRGMDICICTTATTDEEAKELLTHEHSVLRLIGGFDEWLEKQ